MSCLLHTRKPHLQVADGVRQRDSQMPQVQRLRRFPPLPWHGTVNNESSALCRAGPRWRCPAVMSITAGAYPSRVAGRRKKFRCMPADKKDAC
jgi:hypothetical protein